MKMLIFSIGMIFLFTLKASATVTLLQADAAAGHAGFTQGDLLKSKAPFTVRKKPKAKEWNELIAFPSDEKEKTASPTTAIKQLTLTCNQCSSKKLTEAFAVLCYDDIQQAALGLHVDLPGAVAREFENLQAQQKTWPSTDKKVKSYRYTKTILKCEKAAKAEAIRFDFFFN